MDWWSSLDGQAVNLIDPDQIRAVVHSTFTDQPSSPLAPASTIDVVNSSGKDGAAAILSAALRQQGFTTGTISTGAIPPHLYRGLQRRQHRRPHRGPSPRR